MTEPRDCTFTLQELMDRSSRSAAQLAASFRCNDWREDVVAFDRFAAWALDCATFEAWQKLFDRKPSQRDAQWAEDVQSHVDNTQRSVHAALSTIRKKMRIGEVTQPTGTNKTNQEKAK